MGPSGATMPFASTSEKRPYAWALALSRRLHNRLRHVARLLGAVRRRVALAGADRA
jgi:hypothetical protein